VFFGRLSPSKHNVSTRYCTARGKKKHFVLTNGGYSYTFCGLERVSSLHGQQQQVHSDVFNVPLQSNLKSTPARRKAASQNSSGIVPLKDVSCINNDFKLRICVNPEGIVPVRFWFPFTSITSAKQKRIQNDTRYG